jgi:carboxyl-terminal processing protease
MMTNRKAFLAGGLIAFILVGSGFGAGYLTRSWVMPTGTENPLLGEAQALLLEHYFGELPETLHLQRGMIRGMIQAIGDPHTAYLEPAVHELHTNQLAGVYAGIGVDIIRDESGQLRLYPYPDSPAEGAGLRPGDVLLEIDGLAVGSEEEVRALLRDLAGTVVELLLSPRVEGEHPLVFNIERAEFPLPTVSIFQTPEAPNVAVVRISLFSDKTLSELQALIPAEGMDALILDLRGNAGGLIDEGIDVARFFLSDGLILTERRRDEEDKLVHASNPSAALDLPMVVLIDGGTASAAEAVAAALQDNLRAELIGTTSFGKGSIQVVLELSDGSSLHVTTARWTTPAGRSIDGVGLEPDVFVEHSNSGPDTAIYTALDLLGE